MNYLSFIIIIYLFESYNHSTILFTKHYGEEYSTHTHMIWYRGWSIASAAVSTHYFVKLGELPLRLHDNAVWLAHMMPMTLHWLW